MASNNYQVYQLVNNKTNKVILKGTYEDCAKRATHRIEYLGETKPIYRAINNEGILAEGTIEELVKKLNISYNNLYNYTLHSRKSDGLRLKQLKTNYDNLCK